MANLVLVVKSNNFAILKLKQRRHVLGWLNLTINRDLDTLLIGSIDKLLVKNRMDKLFLKSLKISGKIDPGSVFGMVMAVVKAGFEV